MRDQVNDDPGANNEPVVLGEGSKVELKLERPVRPSGIRGSAVGSGIVEGSAEAVGGPPPLSASKAAREAAQVAERQDWAAATEP